MGKEQESKYYDDIYKTSAAYKTEWNKSRYLALWIEVINKLDKKAPVFDVGCGVGQFGAMCLDLGVVKYTGIDFSPVAINNAKKLAPKGEFNCVNVFEANYYTEPNCQFVICETLEHLEEDLRLVLQIREANPGKKVVITVPTFNDPGHARYFKTVEEWKDRYSKLIDITESYSLRSWIIIVGTFKPL